VAPSICTAGQGDVGGLDAGLGLDTVQIDGAALIAGD
jgi:hypothetical protein